MHAHPAPFSYLDLRLNSNSIEGSLVVHTIDISNELNVSSHETLLDPTLLESKREALLGLLRRSLVISTDERQLEFTLGSISPVADQQAVSFELLFNADQLPGMLNVRCDLFRYDPQHQTFLNIYEYGALVHQEILSRDHNQFEHFTGSRQGTLEVLKRFIPAGIYHIFIGPDHILFVVGLLLMGGSLLRLLTIVTAFTIAHSVTLTLAALNIVDVPGWLVEPAIALSIIYVGIDNLMVGKSGRDVRVWIAFVFGLIHGFGFAGVLREFGLPPQALAWSLFSFNLGVEIGQACIVIFAASLLSMLRSRNERAAARLAKVGSIIVIIAGTFWFVQRVFF